VCTATDCTDRAEECRRLARLAIKPEDFGHFLEMAETWELLAKQRKAVEQVADEQVRDQQVADEQVADAGAAAQQADEQLAIEQVANEHVSKEQGADEQVSDEQVADAQLADILALADAIANRRAPLRLCVSRGLSI
jgi:hypothetical protein